MASSVFSLELLQAVVSHHVGLGPEPRSSEKAEVC